MSTEERDQCTGVAATWCPVHGNCTCPRHDDGEPVIRDRSCPVDDGAIHVYMWQNFQGQEVVCDPACPLHSNTSNHAENET